MRGLDFRCNVSAGKEHAFLLWQLDCFKLVCCSAEETGGIFGMPSPHMIGHVGGVRVAFFRVSQPN